MAASAFRRFLFAGGAGAAAYAGMVQSGAVKTPTVQAASWWPFGGGVDYAQVKKDVEALLDENLTAGPILVRLAWHAAGTYDQRTKTGGSDGSTMRFAPESEHGANAGLKIARDLLEPIKKKHPGCSYADLWTLAGATAIESAGGPAIPWRAGRSDAASGEACPPDGRLPDAAQGASHIRQVFCVQMGFSDQETVALIGAHALGHCHKDRSGFDGPWTRDPYGFSNSFFTALFDEKWTPRKNFSPKQFQDESGELMMLPTDMELLYDKEFRKYAELYAKDDDKFQADFAAAFSKLLELGCKNLRTVKL